MKPATECCEQICTDCPRKNMLFSHLQKNFRNYQIKKLKHNTLGVLSALTDNVTELMLPSLKYLVNGFTRISDCFMMSMSFTETMWGGRSHKDKILNLNKPSFPAVLQTHTHWQLRHCCGFSCCCLQITNPFVTLCDQWWWSRKSAKKQEGWATMLP